jgi:GAF domain-containing protein
MRDMSGSIPHGLYRVIDVVRNTARQLIGAEGVTFVLRDEDHVRYLEEDAVWPLWKGQRFPIGECISGWVITHDEPAIIPDVYDDPRVLLSAYRGTFVRSMAMVPVGKPPLGAIGAYWAAHHVASRSEMEMLAAIADSALIQIDD